jgi:hypothetical protein
MWSRIGSLGTQLAATIVLSGAVAMSAHAAPASGRCSVVAGEKLAPGSGGANGICAEVERAMAAALPGVRYTAEVKVISPSRLTATMVVKGHKLPEQHFATMDRNLTPGAVRRFARALAEAAKGPKA